MTKGIIVLDLSAMHGGGTLSLPKGLPRRNKPELELQVARRFLESLGPTRDIHAVNIRGNQHDPPDILFELDGVTTGLELVELLPENRLEKEHILRELRRRILESLDIGDSTRNWVVNITLVDDYAAKLSLPRRPERAFAALLRRFFEGVQKDTTSPNSIQVPAELCEYVRSIGAERGDLNNDPRLQNPAEPLLIFGAQHTNVIPEQDFPLLFDNVVGRKLEHDIASSTWLLIWSNHPAFFPLRDEILQHAVRWFTGRTTRYDRTFYMHLYPGGSITEFSRWSRRDVDPDHQRR